MRILQYSFDNDVKALEMLAEGIHRKYCITIYREQESSGSVFGPIHHASDFLWMRSHSPSVKNGYILGVEESLLAVKGCRESLKLVFVDALPDYTINLWVNSDSIIRAYVFFDLPRITENKLRKLQNEDVDP